MINVTSLRPGTIFKENNSPFLVMRYDLIKMARQGAYVKVKAKNLLSGSVIERSWHSDSVVEEADVTRKNAQYLYKEGNNYVFMDPKTYEQEHLSDDLMGDSWKFLKEGDTIMVVYYEGNPLSIELPLNTIFEVTYTEPGFKGNSVSNVFKPATIETGAEVKVPLFINIGDKIKVDTRTGEYIERA